MESTKIARDTGMRKPFGWIFLLFAIFVGLFTLTRSADKVLSRSWPSADGVVLQSEIYERTGRTHDWCIKLSYRYVVNGAPYVSDKYSTSIIGAQSCRAKQGDAALLLQQYSPGQRIKVLYSPSNPREAIVSAGQLDFLDFFLALLSASLFLMGITLIRKARRMTGY